MPNNKEQLEWAQRYVEKYESYLRQMQSGGGTYVSGVEGILYELASAIVKDSEQLKAGEGRKETDAIRKTRKTIK